jgi:transposase
MSEPIRYLGLDVSKDSIAVAMAEPDGTVASYGTIANDPGAVRRLVVKLSADAALSAAYEAGPTGYALHRQLVSLGVSSQVVAPTLIPRQPGNRVKTDRRDALQLVRLLRRGDLVPVWVPDQAHEALRDLVRARDDARTDAVRAKHRLGKFLLRRGVGAPARVGRAWSVKYQAWLNTLTFSDRAAS